jgi:prephenate dehydrogenase
MQKTVGIIGGMGKMGALFHRLFLRSGYTVRIYDRGSGAFLWEDAAANDVVLLAVPISAMDRVVRELGPYTRPDGLVFDIASVKSRPLETMLAECRGAVMGTHPLCGPAGESIADQMVFLCSGRPNHWGIWLSELFHGWGAHLVELDAETHDRFMAIVQVLRHMLLATLGKTLKAADIDPAQLMPVSGPWFRTLVSMLRHQFSQGPDVYAEIAAANPHVPEITQAWKDAVDEVVDLCAARDRQRLTGWLGEVAAYVESIEDPPSLEADQLPER